MSVSGQSQDTELAQQQLGFAIKDLYRIEKLERVESAYYVFRAVETASGRPVMAYQVRAHVAQRKGYLERFQSDIRKLQRLRSHPAFPEVLDFSATSPEQCYMITVYPAVTDVPLSKQLTRGMPLAKALYNLGLLGEALDTAHREGLIHYHLSPERILLSDNADGERTLRVLGFGLLQHGSDAMGNKSGTEYLAPEQLRNEAADARTDQFVLAAIAYEMISGRKAFAQRGDTQEQIRERILREDPLPVPLSHARESSINSALNKSFSKARQQRHATVRELCTELGLSLDRPLQPPPPSTPPPSGAPRRTAWLLAGLLGALGAAGVLALVIHFHSPSGKRPPDGGSPPVVRLPDLTTVVSPSPDAAAVLDMQEDLEGPLPPVRRVDLGVAKPIIPPPPPPPPPPVPDQYIFSYKPPILQGKRTKLEQCLRGFGAQFELQLTLLSDKYRVASASDGAFQRSNPLRNCLDAAFAKGDLPDPLDIKKEKRGR